MVMTDHFRHEHSRQDADGLIHDALLLGVVLHFDVAAEWEVLAERMPDEAVVGQDAAQARVTAEQNPAQVESLALEPVGARPDTVDGIDDRLLRIRTLHPQPQALVVRDRQEVVGHTVSAGHVGVRRIVARYAATAEARAGGALGLPFVTAVVQVIDTRYVHEHLELQLRRIPQGAADREQIRGVDFVGDFVLRRWHATKGVFEFRFDFEREGVYPLLESHWSTSQSYWFARFFSATG